MMAMMVDVMVHIVGGLEPAAEITGYSVTSLSNYKTGKTRVPPEVFRLLSEHISEMDPLPKEVALQREHKETAEAIQAGFSACIMLQRKETVESIAAQWVRLHSARSWFGQA